MEQEVQKLKEQLFYEPRHVWDEIDEEEKKRAFSLAEEYKNFLNHSKTEREAVSFIEAYAKKVGIPVIKTFRNKVIALARPGKEDVLSGIRLIVAHIDAPRLDLKQRPVYEKWDMSFLKTHYYGGIKKYQWLARPLAIHGRIIKADGSVVDIKIGEGEDEPVFTVLDLLPHLAKKEQYEKKLAEAIEAEKMNVLIGALPFGDKKTENRFKLAVLKKLHEDYGIVEEDLISAELEVVPAGKARDVGFDRSLVGAYGQDDRICAFSALKAISDCVQNHKTAVALFVDKEEIGSDGATGAKAKLLELFLSGIIKDMGKQISVDDIYDMLSRSKALSADVNGALDPDYEDLHEKQNAARLGYGVCVTKFTGHRGKYEANDADAEYIGWIRRLFNENKIIWQTGELGKVDEGGGGTVAKFIARYGIEVVDCGPAILSMHSPFEISHKGDLYMTYKSYKVFFESSD
jgi:aspartyl aminopeptidase